MKLLMRARSLGFLSDAEMARCLDLLSQGERDGKPRRLAQILLDGQLLTSGELVIALKGTAPAGAPTPIPAAPFRMTDSGVMNELAARSAAENLTLKQGERLGEYELLREIARGGMGVLFEARRRSGVIGERVALKVLSVRASTSKSVLARFRQEAGLAASLDHPNIIKIHEVAQDRGFHFIVMDYFEGRSLADLLRAGMLTPKKAVQVVAVVAHAVGYMHSRSVVHRDLKPGNILVGSGGRVCVTDFGLAKDYARTDVQLTQLGVAVGTPAYMSPEQARGELKRIGPPADVYSLGATLYRGLSGVYPYDADSFLQAVNAIIREDPKPLTSVRPDCPEELAAIVHEAMAREPEARPLAEDLGGKLDSFLAENDLLMPPAPANPKV
jgi:serine/threonine protein kinase